MLLRLSMVVVAACVTSSTSCAQTSSDSLQSVVAIQNAVREICAAPDRPGKHISIVADAKGDVSVGILKLVGQADAKATGTFTKEEWSGVRAVLDQTLENKQYRECAEKLTPLFIDHLLPAKDSSLD